MTGIQNNFFNDTGKKEVKEKIERLIDTRYKLVLTLQDLRVSINQSYGCNLELAKDYLQSIHQKFKI